MITADKILAANAALTSFQRGAMIEHRAGGWYVSWPKWDGTKRISRRWQLRKGQDFYPTWSRQWPGGGTSTTALAQLVRWCKGLPVLDISSWRYWASETCKLVPSDAVDALEEAGYPKKTPCVLCGGEIETVDWWHLDDVSGPCCGWTTGCGQRQQPTGETNE